MTVSKEGMYTIEVIIAVRDKDTGEEVTKTTHIDYSLNYAGVWVARNAIIVGMNSELSKLGYQLADSFGQLSDLGIKVGDRESVESEYSRNTR